jgi:hypothetical protein
MPLYAERSPGVPLVPDSQLWLRRPCVHAALTHGMSDVIVIMIIEYHLFHIIIIVNHSSNIIQIGDTTGTKKGPRDFQIYIWLCAM